MEPNLSWVAPSCLPRHLPPCVVASSSIAPDANGDRSLCPVLYRSSYLGGSYFKSLHLRFHHSRVPALSHGGFGGNGRFGGSSNDGGDSGGERDEESSVGPSKSLLSWYLNELEKQPTLTKAWTNAYLTLIGDLICQILIDRATTVDVRRTFVFSFLGFALVGPTLHFWYSFLSKVVSVSGAPGAILRLSLDQFVFSPPFMGLFIALLVALEGRPSHVVPTLQEVWFASVLANWQLWIPFQFVNFQFVPQQFQVLAANMMGLVWNVILSFKAHREIYPKSTA